MNMNELTYDPIDSLIESIDVEMACQSALDLIADRQKEVDVLRLYHLEGMTQVQLAKMYGVSKGRICEVLRLAERRIRSRVLRDKFENPVGEFYRTY